MLYRLSYVSLSSLEVSLERETGFEPATPSLEGSCSSQLSYSRGPPFPSDLRRLRRSPSQHLSNGPYASGGEGRIRTSEGISQQIYSLPRLAASVPLRIYSASETRQRVAALCNLLL